PFIYNQVMLSSGKNVSGVVLRGIDTRTDAQVTNLYKSMIEGKLSELNTTLPARATGSEPSRPGLIIGKELARHLNLNTGDMVNVISPMGNITPMGMI